jgi:hypothetical protein
VHHHSRRETELIEGLHSLHTEVCSRQHTILTIIAELDERKLWRHDGCRDMAQWLAGQLGISPWMALRWVAASHAISNLPLTSKALQSGRLGLDKVLELCRFATPDSEQELIAWARRVTAATIRQRADVFNRPEIEEARSVEQARFLNWWWNQGGASLGLEGLLPAAEGAAFIKAIERAAERLAEAPPEESRSAISLSQLRTEESSATPMPSVRCPPRRSQKTRMRTGRRSSCTPRSRAWGGALVRSRGASGSISTSPGASAVTPASSSC